ncbi:MAG: putative CRISPR-associated protein [Pseudanabaenaceae cyanobacterium SKYGB_i_bin29]|nr:putative CRISPR-associated protein [Pseudanabaenaceae cyanobacterium SKYG29]MDW8420441.1 putative CRISPR-associated protein [Pseudanabaenaceae cyanobacterium SKYGB_i_bin29]
MRQRLICTVGTSLLSNLNNKVGLETGSIKQPESWRNVSLFLLEKSNKDKVCGAEINSIASICQKGFLDRLTELTFLVSDTEEGKVTGQILKLYYENQVNPIRFDNVEVITLAGLNGKSFREFQVRGLKSLVKEISNKARIFTPETIAINATGGYKAQISFAGIIGQALDIPVYYMFEEFPEIIALPAQPVDLNLTFWFEHYPFFEQLYEEETIAKDDLVDPYQGEYYDALVDEVVVDGKSLVSLTPIGLLFHERCNLHFQRDQSVLIQHIHKDYTKPSQKRICIRHDHGEEILGQVARKLCQSPYVKEIINSLPFNTRWVNPIRRIYDNGKLELVLTRTDQGLGLCVQTTGKNKAETGAIARLLVEEYLQDYVHGN